MLVSNMTKTKAITREEYKLRRQKVLDYLKDLSEKEGKNLKAVLFSDKQKTFSNDVRYPFRVNSDFYYITGFTEPNSIAVLDPFSDNPYQLYVNPIDPLYTIWEGHREGLSGAKENFDADISYEAEDFNDEKEPDSNGKSSETSDITFFIHSLRSIKSNAEIELMRRSAQIAVQAHRVAKEIITPGIYEYEVEAALTQVFRQQGGSGWAYPSIVASGENSCILHYISNHNQIKENDLILIDAGCEYEYYASDITRVHHASGSMDQEQQDIYDVVLAAQKAAIESIKPGVSFLETHNITVSVIGEGLQNLGYIKDGKDPQQVRKFFMHGTGHSLGIDVHDVGIDKKETVYVPGMVTTIEPGVYIKEKAIGVRIEDDILVTKTGYENLTEALEK